MFIKLISFENCLFLIQICFDTTYFLKVYEVDGFVVLLSKWMGLF